MGSVCDWIHSKDTQMPVPLANHTFVSRDDEIFYYFLKKYVVNTKMI